MSLETVREFFARHAPDIEIIELGDSTATVGLAAAGHGVSPGQIAKTLSLKVQERHFLVVTRSRVLAPPLPTSAPNCRPNTRAP